MAEKSGYQKCEIKKCILAVCNEHTATIFETLYKINSGKVDENSNSVELSIIFNVEAKIFGDFVLENSQYLNNFI